jgi:hypothetical protein
MRDILVLMKVGLVVMDEDPADALRIVRAADRAPAAGTGVRLTWITCA